MPAGAGGRHPSRRLPGPGGTRDFAAGRGAAAGGTSRCARRKEASHEDIFSPPSAAARQRPTHPAGTLRYRARGGIGPGRQPGRPAVGGGYPGGARRDADPFRGGAAPWACRWHATTRWRYARLAGLVSGCEPRRRGRQTGSELAELRRECERLRRDCARQQALVRATRRTVGLAEAAPAPPNEARPRRGRRPTVRALRVVEQLRAGDGSQTPPEPATEAEAGPGREAGPP